ncbi:low density lipoprotein receptor adapter protein 1-A-like isoform X1 [Xyrauchen texanus]|uniref:low density lipoprotein receptor adapter protein 1-A-like isoform X1 n=1 Tax=Xyrauchen texanus TaxID=154827 RepID=UPI0022426855|nr:low density lipoprotein receptor adapter protein 1-A-like isoform X1 [Xyrauchen texanus]
MLTFVYMFFFVCISVLSDLAWCHCAVFSRMYPWGFSKLLTERPHCHRQSELPENWTDTRETLMEGMTFNLRHLGMTLVDQPKGEELSAAAVKRIVATAKVSGKKLPKVALKVSPQGIVLCDSVSNQLIENISIYRISYCTADKMHDKVFAFIAQNQQNEALECHAFLCAKRKVAQAVTLTVAQAFRVALEFWEVAKEEREQRVKWDSVGETSNSSQSERSVSMTSLKGGAVATENLLDIDVIVEKVDNHTEPNNNNTTTVWEMDDGLEEAFSRLAESRTNPQVVDIGMTPHGWTSDPDWDKTNGNASNSDEIFGL